jgi:Tol biopolymer transport system component
MIGRPPVRSIALATALIFALSVGAWPALAQGPGSSLAASPEASSHAPTGGPVPAGWLVMERFGQAPDGSTTELDFDRRQLWLVRPDGSDLHELAPSAPASGKVSPDVSPDESRIAFSSWHPPVQVYETDVEGTVPRLVSTDCSGLESDCQESDPTWSPDGTHLAVVRREVVDGDAWTWIAIHDVATGTRADLATTRVALDGPGGAYLAQPSWSPDGEHIAYHRTPRADDGYPFGITGWIVDTAGGEPVELPTPDGEDAADLDWSPDGARLVYSTIGSREFEGQETPPARIVSVMPDGSDPIVLCDDRRSGDDGCWAPSWVPDGDRVLFYGYQTWDLVGADGNGNRPLDAAHLTWFGTEPGQGFGYVATWLADR